MSTYLDILFFSAKIFVSHAYARHASALEKGADMEILVLALLLAMSGFAAGYFLGLIPLIFIIAVCFITRQNITKNNAYSSDEDALIMFCLLVFLFPLLIGMGTAIATALFGSTPEPAFFKLWVSHLIRP